MQFALGSPIYFLVGRSRWQFVVRLAALTPLPWLGREILMLIEII